MKASEAIRKFKAEFIEEHLEECEDWSSEDWNEEILFRLEEFAQALEAQNQ